MEGRSFPVYVDRFTSSSDFYSLGDDSSSDGEAQSSGDEIEEDFNPGGEGDESDSFEKEMEAELNEEFSKYSRHLFDTNTEKLSNEGTEQKQGATDQNSTTTDAKETKKDDSMYDEMYFSSGSEADEDNVGGVSSKSKERRMMKSNDELYYDPNMDDEDEEWMKRQRQEHQGNAAESTCKDGKTNDDSSEKTQPKNKSSTKRFTSDAILSCPACLTTLCIDCQRHDIYKQQFRAMFVMNCNVIPDETLRYEDKQKKKNKRKLNKDINSEEPELYNPVQCTACSTEVAVFDKDEVYHFFNVVESLP